MIRGKFVYLLGVTALGLSLATPATAAGEEYYRWVDADGNPVHSDRPPPTGTPYEVISVKTSKARKVREDEDRATDAGPDEMAEAEQRAGAYRTQPVIEKDPERCAQARDNLATLETAPRIRIQGDDGEYRFLTPEEREAHKATAEANISAYCED